MSVRVDEERRQQALRERLQRADARVRVMARIVELRRAGETPTEIGRRLGLHRNQLYRYLRALQLGTREMGPEAL